MAVVLKTVAVPFEVVVISAPFTARSPAVVILDVNDSVQPGGPQSQYEEQKGGAVVQA